MDSLISRQAAIDAVESFDILDGHTDQQELIYRIRQLPPAQPDIIHCEDCAKCQIDSIYHDYWCDGQKVWKTHYCGYAERRTDESN